MSEDVVRDWLHRYQREGPDGLADRPGPGSPPTDRLARQIVDAQMHNGPRSNGLVQACWTVGLLAAFLATRCGLVLSASTVRRHLKAGGWRRARARLDVATHSPAGQRKDDPAARFKLRLIARALSSARGSWGLLRSGAKEPGVPEGDPTHPHHQEDRGLRRIGP